MSNLMEVAAKAYAKFYQENIRFLGYGKPHIPDIEERCLHAFEKGFRAGVDATTRRVLQLTNGSVEQ